MGRRALIIGGSLGGLFAANLLLRAGWDVEVFERAAARLDGRGAGIVIHPPMLDALARAGADIPATLGVDVPGRVTFDRDGQVIGTRHRPQVLTSWSRLYALLDAAFPAGRMRRGWVFERFEQDAGGVVAHFAGGRSVRGDILVGADGIRSAVRGALFPEALAQYAGYVAWRGLAEEAALSPATHAALFERFAFSLPEGEQMLGYPIAGDGDDTRPGHRRYNFVWYRPADDAELRDMQTDGAGRAHALGIPPSSIRPAVIAAMRAAAERVLPPQFAEVVRVSAGPFFQPIYDLASPAMARGRAALLGDAAFVARPHVGLGVTKAAEDAMALTEALAAGSDGLAGADGLAGPDGLAAYAAVRLPISAAIVQRARALGAGIRAQRTTDVAAQYQTPEAVMRETAWIA